MVADCGILSFLQARASVQVGEVADCERPFVRDAHGLPVAERARRQERGAPIAAGDVAEARQGPAARAGTRDHLGEVVSLPAKLKVLALGTFSPHYQAEP